MVVGGIRPATTVHENEKADYDMTQQGVLAVQITTLAMQMQATSRQLCLSFAYQTTRLYHQCVGNETELED